MAASGRGRTGAPAAATEALRGARPAVLWLDRQDAPAPAGTVAGRVEADLAVVGSGFTGLWAALTAAEERPGTSIAVVEAGEAACGATGRNGGFCDSSLTHGIQNALAHWPDEVATLVRLGDQNLAGLVDAVERHGIDCGLEATGETAVAVEPWHLDTLSDDAEACRAHGIRAELLDGPGIRSRIHSPTYLGALHRPDGVVMVDPARLAWGLREACRSAGVRFFDRSPVRRIADTGSGVEASTDGGSVVADHAIVATNAFPGPWTRTRRHVIPVYDHVVATEPLSSGQLASLGWADRQGVADVGNQFHYYRLTPDNRILWGGYDAIYHFGGSVGPEREQRPQTTHLLTQHLLDTFPQLEGIRITHTWGGPIAATTRFTAAWGTGLGGRLAWAAGYTGLGVGASRFGARVALDLIDGRETELTTLSMVRNRPLPFPPEPARWLAVQATRRALQRSDRRGGRRGPWLALLDRFGVGFDS